MTEWSPVLSMSGAIALCLALGAVLLMARRFAAAPGGKSALLMILRGATLAVLMVILLNPVRVDRRRQPGPRPSAVLLVDGSRSMGLERPTRRIDAARQFIEAAEASLPPDRRPRLDRFRFGRDLGALSQGETPQAEDDETRLVAALEELPSRFGGEAPMAVVVLGDGRSTEGAADLAAAARGYRRLGVPVHVVPVGDPAVAGDVAIQDLVAPRDAPPGSKVPVRVVVRSRGYDGRRAEVVIRPEYDDRAEPLATLPLTLVGGEQAGELVVEADRAKGPLVVEVAAQEGEAITENNRVPFRVAPRDGKIRVLYMEGTAGGGQMANEYRWIRDALVEDPEIECDAMEVDNQYNARPRLHRVGDPSKGFPTTREELFRYDVVICSDIARDAFTADQIAWVAELVARRGSGFVMIGGNTSFGSGGWDQTPWDALIPIDMSGRGAGVRSEYYTGDFRLVVPTEAELHPIWRIVDDPARNRQVLDRIPPFHGTNLTDRLKPAATLLGNSDRPLPPSGIIPILSAQAVGRGRSVALATDSTYYWGQDFERTWGEGDNRYFRKFWRNVVRWVTENASGTGRRLRVEADKVIYRPGSPIRLVAHAYDEQLEETDRYRLTGRLLRPDPAGGPAEPLTAPPVDLAPAAEGRLYQGELPAPSAGEVLDDPGSTLHRLILEVSARDDDRVVATTTLDLQVLDDPAEFRDPRPDPDRLAELARRAGGRVLRDPAELARFLAEAPRVPDRVTVARTPLWDTPAVWLLVLVLLSAEWIARRRLGLA